MAFKIKKILTDRQLYRAKFSITLALVCTLFSVGTSYVYGEPTPSYLQYDG